MKYLDLLRALQDVIKVSKAKLPALMAWLDQTLAVLEAGRTGADSLQLVEPTAEETCLEGELAQALTAEGTQAVWDGSRLRKLVALAGEYGPTILTLFKMFSGI